MTLRLPPRVSDEEINRRLKDYIFIEIPTMIDGYDDYVHCSAKRIGVRPRGNITRQFMSLQDDYHDTDGMKEWMGGVEAYKFKAEDVPCDHESDIFCA